MGNKDSKPEQGPISYDDLVRTKEVIVSQINREMIELFPQITTRNLHKIKDAILKNRDYIKAECPEKCVSEYLVYLKITYPDLYYISSSRTLYLGYNSFYVDDNLRCCNKIREYTIYNEMDIIDIFNKDRVEKMENLLLPPKSRKYSEHLAHMYPEHMLLQMDGKWFLAPPDKSALKSSGSTTVS